MKLYVYKGEWGLPSIDLECLQTLCAVKFSDAPVEIILNGNPFLSGKGKLPFLKDEDENLKIVGSQKILQHLKRKGFSVNSKVSKEIAFLSDAYSSLLFNNLHAYFYYVMFGDPQNMELTRTLYAKRTPFPFNFYYPGRINKIANDIVQVFGNFSIHDKKEEHDIEQITLNAKQCVNMLSMKLGNKNWFFGNYPSEFDVNVYAYLSILYHITLQTNPLQLHIRECPNLLKYIDRITKNYFSVEGYKTVINDKSNNKNNDSATILTPSEKEFLESKRKTQIIAFIFAFFAMSSYAVWNGLLQISFDEKYNDYIYNDKDDDSSES